MSFMKKALLSVLALVVLLLLAVVLAFYAPEKSLDEVRAVQGDADSQFVQVNGISAHYKVQGQGPNLLLMHGSQGNLTEFKALAQILSQHYRVYSLDLMGHGLTANPVNNDYSRANFMAFIDDFLRQMKIEKTHTLGHSFSGYLSLHYAMLHPEKMDKMVLLNSYGGKCAGRDYTPGPLIEELPGMETISRFILPKFLVQEELANNYVKPPNEHYVKGVYNILDVAGRRMYAKHIRQYHADFDRNIAGEKNIAAQKLVINSDLDTVHDLCEAENLASRLNNSRLVKIDNAKHGAHMDQPEAVGKAVLEFLAAK